MCARRRRRSVAAMATTKLAKALDRVQKIADIPSPCVKLVIGCPYVRIGYRQDRTMPLTVKELIVVLVLSVPVFHFGRPLAISFMSEEDFSRRRKVWYALTCAAFLSPNFWICALCAAAVLSAAAKRDTNPPALFLFVLHAIPPASQPLPMIGISYLFDVDTNFLLSVCVLAPTAIRLARASSEPRYRRLRIPDLALAAYGILTSVLYARLQDPSGGLYPATFTDCLRRCFVFFLAIFVPYYVMSRVTVNRRRLAETMAAFCFSGALMATTAMFESVRQWLLYPEVIQFWGISSSTTYVMRGDSLRAMASSGHPLALGYLLAIAFGFWLALQTRVASPGHRIGVSILLWLGLLAAYSRGPWIGAVVIYFLFAVLSPQGIRKVLQAAVLSAGILAVISLTPLAERIVRVLPFMGGTVDSGNIEYRQRLFERSWSIIEQSPLLGDQAARLKMQDLRQGEGIIDMINTYMQILLDNGFVGLSLFLTFILVAASRALQERKRLAKRNPAASQIGASLVACTVGTLIMIESGGCDRVMISVLVGLMSAYILQPVDKSARRPHTRQATASLPTPHSARRLDT